MLGAALAGAGEEHLCILVGLELVQALLRLLRVLYSGQKGRGQRQDQVWLPLLAVGQYAVSRRIRVYELLLFGTDVLLITLFATG